MGGNSFGHTFRITTFGESHGEAVGVTIDGVTPGVEIDESYIQIQMDRRKPGQSSITSPRKEYDIVYILSGVYEGRTTGTPVFIILYSQDMKPVAYDDIKQAFRQGMRILLIYRNMELGIIAGVEELLAERLQAGWRLVQLHVSYWNIQECPLSLFLRRLVGLNVMFLMRMRLRRMQ